MELDLGSILPLAIHKSVLNHLDRSPYGSMMFLDMKGRSYEAPAYALSSIEMSGLVFNNVIAKEESEDFVLNSIFSEKNKKNIEDCKDTAGRIGCGLFSDKNLLLDFDYSLFFVSNDLQKLKNLCYNLEEFAKVPYTSDRHFVILKFNTDEGEMRFALDTGCTVCFIRSSLIPHIQSLDKKNGLSFISTKKFEIGGMDFGPLDLYPYDISPELSELDGFLGMDFLLNHVIYIDRENKQVYVQSVVLPD